MKTPKINWSFIKGFLIALVCAGIVYFGYNLGIKWTALEKAWKYPEVVRNLEVENILTATISGTLQK